MNNLEKTRINKFISHNSKYSRREADELIKSRRVKIGQKIIDDLSFAVDDNDKVYIDGVFIKPKKSEMTVIAYNKEKGELVTKKDPMGRKTIYDSLPNGFSHFVPIGRLDFASEGLILLTDSPEIASVLMHGSLERVYKVKIKGNVSHQITEAMMNGVDIVNSKKGAHKESKIENLTFSPFSKYTILKDAPTFSKLKIAICEGLNREIRRFFAHFDRDVVDLKRLEYGGISLNNLPNGKWRYLSKKEYKDLHAYLKDLKQTQ